jgi:protein ImuA
MSTAQHRREEVARLRSEVAGLCSAAGPVLPFGIDEIDGRLSGGGLDRHALHEVTAGSPALSDLAAATLFAAGIAARATGRSNTVLWALTGFDLYAPGLEQAGLAPDRLIFAEARKDEEVLALAEDGLRHGSLAAVIAEVRRVGMTQSRRLQLAAAEGRTLMLLLRSWRRAGTCPLGELSAATSRWRITSAPSRRLGHPGVGRGRWSVELVRQRNGNPFTLTLEACDDQGRLALPAPTRDRAVATGRPTARAA